MSPLRPLDRATPGVLWCAAHFVAIVGCTGGAGEGGELAGSREQVLESGRADGEASAEVLSRAMARVDSAAKAVDSLFQPVPLLTPAQESALQDFSNAEQLGAARRHGVERNLSPGQLESYEREGRLVRLATANTG